MGNTVTRTCSHRYYRNVHTVGLSMNIMQRNSCCCCCLYRCHRSLHKIKHHGISSSPFFFFFAAHDIHNLIIYLSDWLRKLMHSFLLVFFCFSFFLLLCWYFLGAFIVPTRWPVAQLQFFQQHADNFVFFQPVSWGFSLSLAQHE